MFFKGCQIVVVWRTSQLNLCKISLYRKWILSSERAKCVFSNFKKRTHYLGKLTTACFITHLGLSMSQKWAESNLNLCRPWVDIYGKPQRFHRYSRWYLKNSLTWGIDGWHRGGEKKNTSGDRQKTSQKSLPKPQSGSKWKTYRLSAMILHSQFNLAFQFEDKGNFAVYDKDYRNVWTPRKHARDQAREGALGYFLGGYVPPGTPNWHPVLKKISPKIDTPF